MITEQDLREAIAECEGERNPNANTCVKLAAFYTIRDNLYPQSNNAEIQPTVALSKATQQKSVYSFDSGSEFSEIIKEVDTKHVWEVVDELMETLQVLNPRLYDSVIRKLRE